MKPNFHKVLLQPENSYFSVRHDLKPNPMAVWHYHHEIELHYVVKGSGIRFIGDNIADFSSGEIILLGENLPHIWRCNEAFFDPNGNLEVELIVAHFLPQCLGADFLHLPEAHLIPKLFDKAKKGMIIQGNDKELLAKLMNQSLLSTDLERLYILFSILKILAETNDYKAVASTNVFHYSDESDIGQLNRIYNYTLNNYNREISLEEIAAICHMSVSSFCRYFKLMTKKTYYSFLIEVRISHVCRLLAENLLSVEEISYNCGFNNISNFYRHFKRVKSITPFEYKRKHLAL